MPVRIRKARTTILHEKTGLSIVAAGHRFSNTIAGSSKTGRIIFLPQDKKQNTFSVKTETADQPFRLCPVLSTTSRVIRQRFGRQEPPLQLLHHLKTQIRDLSFADVPNLCLSYPRDEEEILVISDSQHSDSADTWCFCHRLPPREPCFPPAFSKSGPVWTD